MFGVFGEFNSAEEINQAAAGLLAEGDYENIKLLAKENGLDPELAVAYINGDIPVLCDPFMAAVGKIELERNGITDIFFTGIKDDIINYILTQCQDEKIARAVRSKGKSLKACFEHIKKEVEKALNKRSGALRDKVVYAMAIDYYTRG